MFNSPRILVCDPDLTKQIIKTNEQNYSKRMIGYLRLKEIIGDGLVTQLGEKHTLHRKLIDPTFKFSVSFHLQNVQIASCTWLTFNPHLSLH
jgi:cytochrome P450